MDLPEGSTVADLLARLRSKESQRPGVWQGIAVSVNAEYATSTRLLRQGDEVGLLPPVSGGSTSLPIPARIPNDSEEITEDVPIVTALTREPIDAECLVGAAKRGEDGAIVVFDGIVRNQTRGRQTLHLDYEAYEEMAAKQMAELAAEAHKQFAVRHVTMVHRLGRLQIGETSVLIVVASAHRAPAFEACRWLIDTLKKTVPIWKKETFADGTVWSAGEPFPAQMAVVPPESDHEK